MSTTTPRTITGPDLELLRASFLRIIPCYEQLCGRLAARLNAGRADKMRLENLLQLLAQAIDAVDDERAWSRLSREASVWADSCSGRRALKSALTAELAGVMSRTEARAWRNFLARLLSPSE